MQLLILKFFNKKSEIWCNLHLVLDVKEANKQIKKVMEFEGIVAILSTMVILPGIIFFFIYKTNQGENEIKRKMIDAGMNPSDLLKKKGSGAKALKNGALFIGIGLALLIARLIDVSLQLADSEIIYFALVGIFGGAALIIAHQINRKQERDDRQNQM